MAMKVFSVNHAFVSTSCVAGEEKHLIFCWKCHYYLPLVTVCLASVVDSKPLKFKVPSKDLQGSKAYLSNKTLKPQGIMHENIMKFHKVLRNRNIATYAWYLNKICLLTFTSRYVVYLVYELLSLDGTKFITIQN